MEECRLLTLVCLCMAVHVGRGQGDPVLDTTKGRVSGKEEDGLHKFMGIPFAKPPVGDLRFRHPIEPDPWSGTKEAKELPNSCWQSLDENFGRFHGVEMWNPNTPRSEDCLYLNVWRPSGVSGGSALPVLVWIYGGGFWAGTSTLAVYDPSKLVQMYDVIVVSLNYRLGPLGFLYSGLEDVPGNAGIMDQVMALKWVKDNAAAMGGNPDKITIMGESAGAASVGYHLLSDLSKPLFNYAVMMSASPYVNWGIQPHHKAKKRFKQLATKLGCDRSKYEAITRCLRGLPPANVTNESWSVSDPVYIDMPFALVTGDAFLPDSISNLMNMNKMKDTSIMTGVVKDEGIYWLLYGFRDVFKRQDPNPVSEDQYRHVLSGIMAQTKYSSSIAQDFTSFIYRDSKVPGDRPSNLGVLDDISGDTLFKCAVRNFAADYVDMTSSDQTYVYSFEYQLSNNPWPNYFGVAHGYEIENFLGLPFLHPSNYSDVDRDVSRKTMDYLTNFVHTGNPNTGSKVVSHSWPKFSRSKEDYLELKETPSSATGLRYSECKYWNMVPELEEAKVIQSTSGCSTVFPAMALIVLLCLMSVWNGSVLRC